MIFPMDGFKKYLIWAEKKYGQHAPSDMGDANTMKEAQKVAEELKNGFGYEHIYIIKIEEVFKWNS